MCNKYEVFEPKLVSNIPTPIELWALYVNDIFVKFPNDHDHDDFLISLNMLYGSIKFTVEVEYMQNLPFLDIIVHLTGSNFEYSVYRKSINKNVLLHFFSFHDV